MEEELARFGNLVTRHYETLLLLFTARVAPRSAFHNE